MCLTYDQIEQACGFLVRGEFNTFLYCCKVCRVEFESGPHLESHILSEHDDDKSGILTNDGFMDESISTDSPIEIDPTNVKIEPDDPIYLVEDDFNDDFNDSAAVEVIVPRNSAVVPKRPVGRPRKNKHLIDIPVESKYGTRNAGAFKEGIYNYDANDRGDKFGGYANVGKRRPGRPRGAKDKKKRRGRRNLLVDDESKYFGRPSSSKHDNLNSKTVKAERQRGQQLKAMNEGMSSDDEPTQVNTNGLESVLQHRLSGNRKWRHDASNDEFGHVDVGNSDRNCKWNNNHNYIDDDSDIFDDLDGGEPSQHRTQNPVGKRRPGRPRGAKDKKKRAARTFASVSGSILKKPRGRPSMKQELTPYNDGHSYEPISTENHTHRPKAEKSVATLSQSDFNFSYAEPFNAGEDMPFDVKSGILVAKKPRGRPRKHPKPAVDVTIPKRPRGRPRGSKTQKHYHSDIVGVDFEELPPQRLRERPSGQRNWIDDDSGSDSNSKRGNDGGENQSHVNIGESILSNAICSIGPKRRGRPPGLKKNKIINLRPIKIELDDSVAYEPSDQPLEISNWPTEHDSQAASTSISNFCKPFEIQLEDIYSSNQVQNWLEPTSGSESTSRPRGRPPGSKNKYH
ncbi:uncharacterized protein LOC129568929 [Sitodiplosis mosellana]|uniref:uncharacterized protein LOC129568929 n=1 Tax=Sitodiplosis mosellana TaxID=263140 RepID=UPI0024447AD5|nr:uncharacterized protein LOC129568929 [Sitodiplosis mosellana]